MALQGNLRDFSVTEVLQLLGSQKKTGSLRLDWNSERSVLYMLEGRIVSTREAGLAADDSLLRFLVKVHRLSDEQRRGLQSLHRESSRDLEDLLVNGRYLDGEEIQSYLERQILNDLTGLVRWENGNYRFDPKNVWPYPPRVRLSMEGALIEAARRVDEQKRFMGVFKDPYELLGVRDLPDPDEPLTEEEKDLFGIIDGQHTVTEIVDAAPLTEYEAYEALHRMLEAQWIEVVGRRDPGRAVASVLPSAEVQAARRVPWLAEIGVAVTVVVMLAALQFTSRVAVRGMPPLPLAQDVFAQRSLDHVRGAIELYRLDHGRYPDRLARLVDEEWLEPAALRVPGRRFAYRLSAAGDYQLTLGDER
jgi:hypothetical protein